MIKLTSIIGENITSIYPNLSHERRKAGVLPYFFENGVVRFLLVKSSSIMHGGPDWQLCKGIMDESDQNYLMTALREAHEMIYETNEK